MTVALIVAIDRYVGVAADTKPTGSDVEAGSEFYETDTRTTHIYDGTGWNLLLGVDE